MPYLSILSIGLYVSTPWCGLKWHFLLKWSFGPTWHQSIYPTTVSGITHREIMMKLTKHLSSLKTQLNREYGEEHHHSSKSPHNEKAIFLTTYKAQFRLREFRGGLGQHHQPYWTRCHGVNILVSSWSELFNRKIRFVQTFFFFFFTEMWERPDFHLKER